VPPSDIRAKSVPTASTSVVCALGLNINDDSLDAVPYQAKFLWQEAGARNQWLRWRLSAHVAVGVLRCGNQSSMKLAKLYGSPRSLAGSLQ
jgi:hypothetical protein